jgi:hypothetical protein
MEARRSYESLTAIYQTHGITIPEDDNLNENLAASRFAKYTVRERMVNRTTLIKAMSPIRVR